LIKKKTSRQTCIYTGILTDSGSFRFPGTTGNTHRIVAELIDLGVENTKIPTLLLKIVPTVDCSYWAELQNLKVIPEHQTTYTTLTQDELNTFDYVKEILKAS
jgi:phosphoesterase RecJ-like protein